MSALEKLKGLMQGLKTIEHDRWDTAAHAVLELEHKVGLGDGGAAIDLQALAEKASSAIGEKLKPLLADLKTELQKEIGDLKLEIEKRVEAKFNDLLAKATAADTPQAAQPIAPAA